jgi:hypothetical protein
MQAALIRHAGECRYPRLSISRRRKRFFFEKKKQKLLRQLTTLLKSP